MITQTLTRSQFADAFISIRPDNFTYEGLMALYDYFEDYSKAIDEDYNLDVIAVCCDFSEYESLQEVVDQHSNTFTADELQDDKKLLDYFNDRTTVIPLSNGHIILLNY